MDKLKQYMKKASLLIAVSCLIGFSACGNTENVKSEQPLAETVAPEIGPAQEIGAKLDNLADSIQADAKQTKTEAGQAIDTAKKGVKKAAVAVKETSVKVAKKVAETAKDASHEIKTETNKAAKKVQKAAKDVKKDLSE